MSDDSIDATAELLDGARPARSPARIKDALTSRPGATAAAVYALLALFADLPIYPGDPSAVPSALGVDIVQTTWFLEWTPWAILHGHSIFATTLINYPTGVNLAQNTGIPLLGLITAPLTLLVSPIASMNLLRWIAFWLSAYAAFAVLRKVTTWTPAAFVGGLLYGFSPYMTSQGSLHLNLYFVPLPPVILYLLFEILVTQRRSALRTGGWLGVACVAQFYISAEVLATTLVVAALALFILFFACIREVRARLPHAVQGLVLAGVVLAVCTGYPIWLMFKGPNHYVGPAQGYTNVYNADLLGPVIPTLHQLVAPAHLRARGTALVGNNPQENGSYLGIPLILLLIIIVVRYWRKLWSIFVALAAFAVFVFSLGSRLLVNGHRVNVPFELPFKKFIRLPGIDNILPVRLSLYVVFLAAVLVALGLEWYHEEILARQDASPLPPRRRALRVFTQGVVALLGVAATVALLPNWPYVSYSVTLNGAVQAKSLRIIPSGAAVLTYPYSTAIADQPMLWQALDNMGFRTFGSYALLRGPKGGATVAPHTLQPAVVQATWISSLLDGRDPAFPEDIATASRILAHSVNVIAQRGPRPRVAPGSGQLGQVTFVDAKHSKLVINTDPRTPVWVSVSLQTRYLEHGVVARRLHGVIPGAWVLVVGTRTTGTVTPALVSELRVFLRVNKVQAIVIQLGLRDAWEIGVWVRRAIGAPTIAGQGGEIWTDVQPRVASRPAAASAATRL